MMQRPVLEHYKHWPKPSPYSYRLSEPEEKSLAVTGRISTVFSE
jgi:hypothetical protein